MKENLLTGFIVVLFFYIVLVSGPFFVYSLPFVIIQIISYIIIIWAFTARKIYRKHMKKAAGGSFFIKEGPYEFIRHPVYTGLLLLTSTYVQEALVLERGFAFLVFVFLVLVKVSIDERKTEKHFGHAYAEHKKTTKKLIPYLY